MPQKLDVAIIGAGPCGLAAATELARLGSHSVTVFERETEAGGVPRHCGHPPFGMREFKRIHTGPGYTRKLIRRAINSGVDIQTGVSVISLHENGCLVLSSNAGTFQVEARRVLLCTGTRETPRSTRLVSGVRALGIMTTGALQSIIYLKNQRPCERPLIVGTELVSFSALLTCRHAGIKPVAMIEKNSRISAHQWSKLLPRILGVDLRLNTEIVEISGDYRVKSVQLRNRSGQTESVECDSVIFSGQFIPEASLCRTGHLKIDEATGGPIVDQFGRCSDPTYYAAGNVLRGVETAGWCWREGVNIASVISHDLKRPSNTDSHTRIKIGSDVIKYVMPSSLALPMGALANPVTLQVRLTGRAKGTLQLKMGRQLVASRKINSVPERRILFSLKNLPLLDAAESLELTFEDA